MPFVKPYKDKPKSQFTKQKLQSGTISKVLNESFSKEDLETLWKKHNELLDTFDNDPTNEKYARTVSDLIKNLRDVSEKLICAGAIPEYQSRKDTTSYVWKQLKDRNIHYSKGSFYRYFSEEQKRDYQSPAFLEKIPGSAHKHDFGAIIGNFEGVGEIRACVASGDVLCQAKMIDGQVYENMPDKDTDADLTRKPKPDPIFYEEENEYILMTYQKVIESIKSVQQYYIRHRAFSELSDKDKKRLRDELLLVEKSTEFINSAFNDKNKIPTMAEHLLVLAFAEATQKAAGGTYLSMFRKFGAEKVEQSIHTLSKYISSKQTTKKMAGKTSLLHPRYDPKTAKEAMDRGFYGAKCSNKKCPSFGFRIDYDRIKVGKTTDKKTGEEKDVYDTKLICFACQTIQTPDTIKLEKMHPKVTMNWQS